MSDEPPRLRAVDDCGPPPGPLRDELLAVNLARPFKPPASVLEQVRKYREDYAEILHDRVDGPMGWYVEAMNHAGAVAAGLSNDAIVSGGNPRYRKSARRECLITMALLWELYEALLIEGEARA